MASYYTLSITEQNKKHIPTILTLAKKHNGTAMFIDTKDLTGYEVEFNSDTDRLAFKAATDALGLF